MQCLLHSEGPKLSGNLVKNIAPVKQYMQTRTSRPEAGNSPTKISTAGMQQPLHTIDL
jgi:hypothetical protein